MRSRRCPKGHEDSEEESYSQNLLKSVINKVCKKYYGNYYNYAIAMYYISNFKKLGTKTLTYSKIYLNNLQLNCKYNNQNEINILAYNIDSKIPETFIKLFSELK
jgi:hypothetical protein